MLKCNLCSETFQDEIAAKSHFISSHGANKCQLCNREGAAKASTFCHPCKSLFLPEINAIESLTAEAEALQRKMISLANIKRSKMVALKTKFITRYTELFCTHNIPKAETCEKCEKFASRDVKSSKTYVHIEL